ncbi:MAG: serine hydrolase domain-containing protein, partial [Longimicrobiales bacterium]
MPAPMKLALVLFAFLVLPPAPAASQQFPPDDEVQTLVQTRVDNGGAKGIALGLLEADGSTRTFSAGTAGTGEADLTPSTLFEIGSITKVFTGTLLADMTRRGEVSLTDPVQTLLPDGVTMPERNGAEIKLVDLATHRSALPRLPSNFAPADPSDPYADYSAEMLYDFLSSYELTRDIGAEAEYSNLAVGLLGHVLAERVGMTYEEAVRSRILDPLEMDMTTIELTAEQDELMAKGHDPAGAVVPLWDVGTLAGAGGLRSNVTDMLRFLAANVGEPSTEVELALRDAHEARVNMGESMDIGLNWITRTTDGQRTVWHNGGTGGFRTFVGFDPDA